MEKPRIFLVEDENDISEIIAYHLTSQGYEVEIFNDGKEAIDYIQKSNNPFNLFILDRMLPNMNGIEICKFLRLYQLTRNTPILFITALTTPENIVEGLEAGADDYITKPFDSSILLARVKALLRRHQITISGISKEDSNKLISHNIVVDTDQCKTMIDNKEIELTLSEYKILLIFLKSPGKVYTRNQLVELIQEGPVHVTDRTIDTHIFGLRKKLEDKSVLIETIRGIGYRIKPEE